MRGFHTAWRIVFLLRVLQEDLNPHSWLLLTGHQPKLEAVGEDSVISPVNREFHLRAQLPSHQNNQFNRDLTLHLTLREWAVLASHSFLKWTSVLSQVYLLLLWIVDDKSHAWREWAVNNSSSPRVLIPKLIRHNFIPRIQNGTRGAKWPLDKILLRDKVQAPPQRADHDLDLMKYKIIKIQLSVEFGHNTKTTLTSKWPVGAVGPSAAGTHQPEDIHQDDSTSVTTTDSPVVGPESRDPLNLE